MNKHIKCIAIAVPLLIGAAVVLGIWLQGPNRSWQLADGSWLTLVEARLGKTNAFVIGSPLQRLIGGLVPSNGVSVLGFKLTRPVRRSFEHSLGEELGFLFRLSGATNNANVFLDRSYSAPQFRLVMRASSGHEYEGYLTRFDFLRVGADYYAFGSMTAFPRDEKWLDAQVVADREGNRQVIARFKLRNPEPRSSLAWKADDTPVTRKFDQIKMTLGEVTTGPRLWRVPRDPAETGSIPLQVLENGMIATNWSLHEILVRDGLGNYSHISVFPIVSNDWCYHALWGVLDPARVWKLEAHLARSQSYYKRAEDFSSNELCTIRLNLPLRGIFQTNFIGGPVEFRSWNSGVEAQMPTNRSDLRLSFVSASDKNGKKYENLGGNWDQWHFARMLDASPPRGELVVTFAIHRDYFFECFVQPKPKTVRP